MDQLGLKRMVLLLAVLAGCGGSARPGPSSDAGAEAGIADADADADADGPVCDPADAGADRRRSFLDLRITGSGFEAHEGQAVSLYTSGAIQAEVYGSATRTVAGGSFAFDFPSGYRRSALQGITWFVDADGDGACSSDGPDHTGFISFGPFDPAQDDRIDVAVTDNHASAIPGSADRCAGATAPLYDFHITGSGFDAHEGQTIHLVTSSPYNGVVRGAGQAKVAGGAFSFLFPKGFERMTYQDVFWFIDTDGDTRCTDVDDTGYLSTAAFTAQDPSATFDVTITDNHTGRGAHGEDVCAVMNGCRAPL